MQLLGSGTILREVIATADLLAQDFNVAADVWSCPSFTELAREAMTVERWNLLHPTEGPRKSRSETCLGSREGPVVAATDYMRLFADQIGRSCRAAIACSARMDSAAPTIASACATSSRSTGAGSRWRRSRPLPTREDGPTFVAEAIAKYGIDPEKARPGQSELCNLAIETATRPTRSPDRRRTPWQPR